jgi:3-hydroxyacyl-CoA dehydrogenase
MNQPIRRVAVLGAGVMGAGIAAHLANAGIEVELLDIVPPGLSEAEKADPAARNRFSQGGLDKALKARPAAFTHPSRAVLVRCRQLRRRPRPRRHRRPRHRGRGREHRHQAQALFTKLEALVGPSHARGEQHLRAAHRRHARGAQRVVSQALHGDPLLQPAAVHEAPRARARRRDRPRGLRPRQALRRRRAGQGRRRREGHHQLHRQPHRRPRHDGRHPPDAGRRAHPRGRRRIVGTPMGRPKSAAFRTADMVGLDTFAHVADNCYKALTDDEDRDVFQVPAYIRTMVEKQAARRQDQGRLLQEDPRGRADARPGDGRVPREEAPPPRWPRP